jgi:hypothetical protein
LAAGWQSLSEAFVLALHLVIGVGIALLFPLLIYTGVAVMKAPPKSRDFLTHVRGGISAEEERADEEIIGHERNAWQAPGSNMPGCCLP